MMMIKYQTHFVSQNVDIKKLRPEKSYDYLIENRTAGLDQFNAKSDLVEGYLINRCCPCCAGSANRLVEEKDGFSIVECDACGLIFVNPILHSEK